jgi:hypothetical protein
VKECVLERIAGDDSGRPGPGRGGAQARPTGLVREEEAW